MESIRLQRKVILGSFVQRKEPGVIELVGFYFL